jgi:5'-nucleotidase
MLAKLTPLLLLAPLCWLPFTPTGSAPATGTATHGESTTTAFDVDSDLVQLPARPRILIVNDDGIDSPGIHTLARALHKIADVTVVAPDGNRSGSSGSSTVFSEELTVVEQQMEGVGLVYSVSGTPVDAADFGLRHLGLDNPFDLVVSGINAGSNVGEVAHYSGTVGAAYQGPANGIPGIAFSQADRRDFTRSAEFALVFVQRLIDEGAHKGMVYSINVPNAPKQALPVRAAEMGGRYLKVKSFRRLSENGNTSVYRARTQFDTSGPQGSDTKLMFENHITITPIRFNWTDHAGLQKLQQWKFDDVR